MVAFYLYLVDLSLVSLTALETALVNALRLEKDISSTSSSSSPTTATDDSSVAPEVKDPKKSRGNNSNISSSRTAQLSRELLLAVRSRFPASSTTKTTVAGAGAGGAQGRKGAASQAAALPPSPTPLLPFQHLEAALSECNGHVCPAATSQKK
jgi:hypothetical protein